MIKLTEEMRIALDQMGQQPVMLEDEQTHARYVLLPAAVFERLRAMFADDAFDAVDAAAAQSAVAGAAGWDDPEMAVYDDFHDRNSRP